MKAVEAPPEVLALLRDPGRRDRQLHLARAAELAVCQRLLAGVLEERDLSGDEASLHDVPLAWLSRVRGQDWVRAGETYLIVSAARLCCELLARGVSLDDAGRTAFHSVAACLSAQDVFFFPQACWIATAVEGQSAAPYEAAVGPEGWRPVLDAVAELARERRALPAEWTGEGSLLLTLRELLCPERPEDLTAATLARLSWNGEAPETPLRALVDARLACVDVTEASYEDPAFLLAEALALGAALLALLERRSQVPTLDVVRTLALAGQLTQLAGGLAPAHGPGREAVRSLQAALTAAHGALGRPRVPYLTPRDVVRRVDGPEVLVHGRLAVGQTLDLHEGRRRSAHREVEDLLWAQLDHLERAPGPLRLLAARCAARWGLCHVPRGYGVPLLPAVETACVLTGVPVTWGRGPGAAQDLSLLGLAARCCAYALLSYEADPDGEPERSLVVRAITALVSTSREARVVTEDAAELGEILGRLTPAPLPRLAPSPAALIELDRDVRARWAFHLGRPAVVEAPPEPAPQEESVPGPAGERAAGGEGTPLARVRARLRGARVVLLGGTVLPRHHDALVRAFDLGRLDWLPAERYVNGEQAGVAVGEDVALVLYAVRWSGHSHNSIRDVAARLGVPWVLLPGGLNPNMVAYQIEAQVSRKLGLSA